MEGIFSSPRNFGLSWQVSFIERVAWFRLCVIFRVGTVETLCTTEIRKGVRKQTTEKTVLIPKKQDIVIYPPSWLKNTKFMTITQQYS
jgi:hypothetical protein